MGTILFASDLDNTLLFSQKHALAGDVCVEWLNGAPQGYLTGDTPSRLAAIMEKALFVPVTSRSVVQYLRIQFPDCCRPRYAVTTNGAILLENGEIDRQWQAQSQETVQPWQGAMAQLLGSLEALPEAGRFGMVDGMYVFSACDGPEQAQALKSRLEGDTPLTVEVTGRKVYFFPPPLSKGAAIPKLRRRFQAGLVICAGDSPIDGPMLEQGDVAIAPNQALLAGLTCREKRVCAPQTRFYDFVLREAARYIG